MPSDFWRGRGSQLACTYCVCVATSSSMRPSKLCGHSPFTDRGPSSVPCPRPEGSSCAGTWSPGSRPLLSPLNYIRPLAPHRRLPVCLPQLRLLGGDRHRCWPARTAPHPSVTAPACGIGTSLSPDSRQSVVLEKAKALPFPLCAPNSLPCTSEHITELLAVMCLWLLKG